MTTLTATAACTKKLLGMQENIKWGWMKLKLSWDISIVKGELRVSVQCLSGLPKKPGQMVHWKPQGQRAGANTKAEHCELSGECQQDPAARESEALVPTRWTSPLDTVVTHCLWDPYRENHQFKRGKNSLASHNVLAASASMTKESLNYLSLVLWRNTRILVRLQMTDLQRPDHQQCYTTPINWAWMDTHTLQQATSALKA